MEADLVSLNPAGDWKKNMQAKSHCMRAHIHIFSSLTNDDGHDDGLIEHQVHMAVHVQDTHTVPFRGSHRHIFEISVSPITRMPRFTACNPP